MKKYYCDICGREVPREEHHYLVAEIESEHGTLEVTDEFGALCSDCLRKVAEYIEKLKEKEVSEG